MSEFKFSCPICGQNVLCDTVLEGTQHICPHCNNTIGVPTEFAEHADIPPGLPDNAAVTAQRTSRLAIASLVCSLSSFVTCIGWLPGIICGHLARSRIRREPSLKGGGLATAGLVLGYLILMLEAGTAGVQAWRLSAAVKQGFDNVRQDLATNNIIITQNQSTTVSNDNQQMESASPLNGQPGESTNSNSEWVADISQVSFPDHLAGGKVHGLDFIVKTALFRNGDLKLSSANGVSLEIIHGLGASIAGQSYEFQPGDDSNANPRVRINWTEGAVVQSQTFSKGYGLKLEFAKATNRTAAAKIYVCFPDDSKSCVAGTFKVRIARPK